MERQDWLARAFEENRSHLQAVAYRLLGSLSEADDAVQETWLRLSRPDMGEVSNLGGWLTTVVARVSLNMLRARKTRREESLEASMLETGAREADASRVFEPGMREPGMIDPEQEAELSDSVGLALLVILDRLSPAERLAFVLHDVFAVPFEEIAPIVERSEVATRQLASRARRRIRGGAGVQDADLSDLSSQREVVDAFLAASRVGNFDALLALLDPDIVYRADWASDKFQVVRGATAVVGQARAFLRLARFAQPALVNGAVGVVVAPFGQLRYVAQFTIIGAQIAQIHVIADPTVLRQWRLGALPN